MYKILRCVGAGVWSMLSAGWGTVVGGGGERDLEVVDLQLFNQSSRVLWHPGESGKCLSHNHLPITLLAKSSDCVYVCMS